MWLQRWETISISIESLLKAASPFFASVTVRGDYYGTSTAILIPEAKSILGAVEEYHRTFKDVLPPPAEAALSGWIRRARGNKHEKGLIDKAEGDAGVGASFSALAALLSLMTRYLADHEVAGKAVTERAFLHLQRSIAVDEGLQQRWLDAFQHREEYCEKLGDLHLLLHGVWAFKVDADGERTDLVFGNSLGLGDVQKSAPAALVLTEWKRAAAEKDARKMLEVAKKQADRYKTGSLADFELSRTRFLVIVTRKHVNLQDISEGPVTYRAINIAVEPDSPSVGAKKAASTT